MYLDLDRWYFNEDGSSYLLDTSLALECPKTRLAHEYINGLQVRQASVEKAQIDPSSMRDFLDSVILVDVLEGVPVEDRFRVRLIGTSLTPIYGHITGKSVQRVLSGQAEYGILAALNHVATTGRMLRLESNRAYKERDWLKGEGFYAPLLDSTGSIGHIFITVDFTKSFD